MQAVVVAPNEKRLELVERPAPRISGGAEVLLRTLEVGICGTDREICTFEYGEPPPGRPELILGHEAIAEVVDVGPDVTWLSPGDLAVPIVRHPCKNRRCAACRHDRADFCSTGEFSERGIVRADGFLCETFVEHERFLVPVPRAIRDVAVLVEPLTIAAKSAQGYKALQARFTFAVARKTGLVIGAGPIGLLGAMTLRAYGVQTHVFSGEPDNHPRAELARAIGATYSSATSIPLECLHEHIGQVDVIFEAAGVPALAFGALSVLAPNGVLIMSGVPVKSAPVAADLSGWMHDLVLHNKLIVGTVNAGRDEYEVAIRALEQFLVLFPDALRSLVRRGPIDEAVQVLRQGRGIKDVVALA